MVSILNCLENIQNSPAILNTTTTGPNSSDKAQDSPRKGNRAPRQPSRPAQDSPPLSPGRRLFHRVEARQAPDQALVFCLAHLQARPQDPDPAQEPQAPREAPPGPGRVQPRLAVRRPALTHPRRGPRWGGRGRGQGPAQVAKEHTGRAAEEGAPRARGDGALRHEPCAA